LAGREWGQMGDAFAQIAESKLFVDDTPSLGIFDLRSKARRLQARHGLSVLIVDYLQLMDAPSAENRNNEIAKISRGLKLAARELKVPVVVLSQLSRDVEKRGEKRPMLSDLRDSGALEQDADAVLFVHRPEYYEPDRPELQGLAEIIVAKQRNGPTGVALMTWDRQHQRFLDRSRFD
jgi:replicative DNA helicase